jgi:hypothetical protein
MATLLPAGQACLQLFHKPSYANHLLRASSPRRSITLLLMSVPVPLITLLEIFDTPLLSFPSKEQQRPASYEKMFLKRGEKRPELYFSPLQLASSSLR